VPVIGNNAFWAYTRWFQRGIVALELNLGMGLSDGELTRGGGMTGAAPAASASVPP